MFGVVEGSIVASALSGCGNESGYKVSRRFSLGHGVQAAGFFFAAVNTFARLFPPYTLRATAPQVAATMSASDRALFIHRRLHEAAHSERSNE
jgi:hypothetical protein